MLTRIFGPMRKEIIEQQSKLYKQELHNLDSLPNITEIKSGMMRFSVHKAHTGKIRNVSKILFSTPEEKNYTHGRIILNIYLKKQV
jgi:hypothetical protein